MMDTQTKTIATDLKTTVERLICSPHFNNIILIAPKGLNDITVTSQYQEIPMKQIRKKYFEVKQPKMHHVKRKDTTSPSRKFKKESRNK